MAGFGGADAGGGAGGPAPRMMVMSRKGGPALSSGGKGKAPDTGGDNNAKGGDRTDEGDAGETVTCPECGCQFDPHDAEQAGNTGDAKGPELQMPSPAGDAQAPVGEDAITRAVAAVLAGGHGA